MPLFNPRNRVQIRRDMLARVVGRSELTAVEKSGTAYHMVAAASNEDAEQYLQMSRLRLIFSIDDAKGQDLDERAQEIVPGRIARRGPLTGSTPVIFTRNGTSGTLSIPAGTLIAAEDAEGQIRFRTTATVVIADGSADSPEVTVASTIRGSRANVADGEIRQFVTRIPDVVSVNNAAKISNGRDRESDDSFRARIKAYVQALSRGTPRALAAFAQTVVLRDGRRVVFATVREPIIPTGIIEMFIDDGTGAVEETDDVFIGAFDVPLASAIGGEQDIFMTNRPIKDDGSFEFYVGGVLQTRGVDYELNPALGQVELSEATYPVGMPPGASGTAHYRSYTGLIRETQKVLDGDSTDILRYPGVRAGGIQVLVKAPQLVPQSLTAQARLLDGFDPAEVASLVETAVQDYINGRPIGDHVIVAELVERMMSVSGMYDLLITDLSGSGIGGANQVILRNQVARITAGNITIT